MTLDHCRWKVIVVRVVVQALVFALLAATAYAIYLSVASREQGLDSNPKLNVYVVVHDGLEGLWFLIQSFQVGECNPIN